jgi:hypothetical protein
MKHPFEQTSKLAGPICSGQGQTEDYDELLSIEACDAIW